MITKAIVEQVIDKYSVRVRIPRLDRTTASSVHTATEDLNIATISTLPNCDPNLRPGDIVFIHLDRLNEDEAVIIGCLYREKRTEAFCDLILNSLTVNHECIFPYETTIGQVTSDELAFLHGVTGNIQNQLNLLQEQINLLIQKE